MSRRSLLLLIGLAGLGGVACAGSLARPIESDVRWAAQSWPDSTLAKLEQGRSLYVEKCAGCHDLHAPAELPPHQWSPAVLEMAKQAHLSSTEQQLVIAYLSSTSARARGITIAARTETAPTSQPQ